MVKKGIFISMIICCSNILFAQIPNENKPVATKEIILGIVDSIRSEILGEDRFVNICLPEGYSPTDTINYPVIYLLDGGTGEDFIHISGLVRFNTTPWIKRFPASIVVGIENVNRRRDFTFPVANLDFVTKMGFDKALFKENGGSGKFISFIEKELQPFIKSHYKANNAKTIIGESLGGLLATEILLKRTTLFDTYIIVSPSLWWGSGSLLNEISDLSKYISADKLKVYIGASNKAEDTVMYNDANKLYLQLKKYDRTGIHVSFDYLSSETHATILHQAVYNAFKVLYPRKK